MQIPALRPACLPPSQYAHIWNAGVIKAYFLTVTFICVIQLLCFQDLHFHVVYTILFTFTSSIVLACSSIVHYVCMYMCVPRGTAVTDAFVWECEASSGKYSSYNLALYANISLWIRSRYYFNPCLLPFCYFNNH